MAFTLSGDVATTRTNLGLGDAATKTTGTAAGNVPVLDSSGDLAASTYTDTVYTHPTTAGNKHIPTAGATDQVLTYSSSGTATWADAAGGGKVLQVKNMDFTSRTYYNSASWSAISGYSLTFDNDLQTGSKILVWIHCLMGFNSSSCWGSGERLGIWESGSEKSNGLGIAMATSIGNAYHTQMVNGSLLFTPGTLTTPTVQVMQYSEACGMNINEANQGNLNHQGASTMTIMEIGA